MLAVGGYDPRMATEDIDLTWKLLLAGWETVYEPHALVGMQVPSTLRALWAQRKRWARGQGEVLHVTSRRGDPLAQPSHVAARPRVARVAAVDRRPRRVARHRRARRSRSAGEDLFGFAFAWGIAIAVVATLQLIVALCSSTATTRRILRAFLVAALIRSPTGSSPPRRPFARRSSPWCAVREQRVVWDIPREQIGPERSRAEGTLRRDR